MSALPPDGDTPPPPSRVSRPDREHQEWLPAPVRIGHDTPECWEYTQRVARGWASSTLVPAQFRMAIPSKSGEGWENNPAGLPNCIVALNMAQRLRADVLMVMQNLYIVEGRPSWKAEFVIGQVNQCGRYEQLEYDLTVGDEIEVEYETTRWEGPPGSRRKVATKHKVRVPDMRCVAWAVDRETRRKLVGPAVTMRMAVAEGWYGKAGSKWQTMPELMIRYRAGAFWQRLYAPQLTMGYRTAEEEHDILETRMGRDGVYETVDVPSQAPAPTRAAPPRPAEDVEAEPVEEGAADWVEAPVQQEPASPEEPAPPAAEGFQASLVTEHGEVTEPPYTDPGSFVAALIDCLHRSANPQAVIEHNEGAIADARDADRGAAALLDQALADALRPAGQAAPGPNASPAQAESTEAPIAALAVPEARGRPDWAAYTRELAARLAQQPAEQFERFMAFHRSTMVQAPHSQRLEICKAASAYCREAGIGGVPDWVQQLTQLKPPPAFPTEPSWPVPRPNATPNAWVDETCAWLDGLTDFGELHQWLDDAKNQRGLSRLREAYPGLADIVQQSLDRAEERVTARRAAP